MLKRYFLILLVTVWVAFAPIELEGYAAWAASSTISIAYIFFVFTFSCIRERDVIIYIESSAMIASLIAFLQHHTPQLLKQYLASESQWFWVNYEHIMGYCFLMEIVVIIIGITNSAEFRRILFVCIPRLSGDKRCYRDHLCT